MTRGVGFLFSTFAMRRAEFAVQQLPGFSAYLQPLIDRAAPLVSIDANTFYYPGMGEVLNGLPQTQQVHYASYLEGVAAGSMAERLVGECDYAAGYSMGIYAALCHLGAITFEDGLRLMNRVCVAVHDAVADDEYAIGAIEGLTADAVRALIAKDAIAVALIDVYGPVTLVVSGKSDAVKAIIASAEQAGAVYVRHMPATAPYHTTDLRKVESDIRGYVQSTPVSRPRAILISALNQQPLATADDVREELARNVLQPMNWLATTQALVATGVTTLCECGSSASLANMAKREVPGAYEVADLRALASSVASR